MCDGLTLLTLLAEQHQVRWSFSEKNPADEPYWGNRDCVICRYVMLVIWHTNSNPRFMNELHLAEQKMVLNKLLYLFLRGSLLSESGDRNDTFTPLKFNKSLQVPAKTHRDTKQMYRKLIVSVEFVRIPSLSLFWHNMTLPSSCVCCSAGCCSGSVWVGEAGGSFSIFSSVTRLSLDWQQELDWFGSSLFSKELSLMERHSNNARTFTSEISWAVWERKMAREYKCYCNAIYHIQYKLKATHVVLYFMRFSSLTLNGR